MDDKIVIHNQPDSNSSATPLACPSNWPADDPRQCTGGAGNTSFFGAGMVNAEAAASH